jgi:hypothetical protein
MAGAEGGGGLKLPVKGKLVDAVQQRGQTIHSSGKYRVC